MDLHIIPECYIDTKLIKALVPTATRYNHQKGCPTVVKVMKERFGKDFALGIIDRDKKELGYVSEFDLVVEIPLKLALFKHRQKNHYLIFICPAMEKWVISCADEVAISLSDFNLPHDFKKLRGITKTAKSENQDVHSDDLQQLFKALKKSDSKVIRTLQFWVEYLKRNSYQADLEHIRKETEKILQS